MWYQITPLLFCMIAIVHARVTFSEIMFDAEGADYHDEFIELYNLPGGETMDLSGWTLQIGGVGENITGRNGGLLLLPGQYAVILDLSYFDSSTRYDMVIPDSALRLTISDKAFGTSGLPNSTDTEIVLLDAGRRIIDRYTYSTGNSAGYSDEKIVPEGPNDISNWSNSQIKGGTPGMPNSVSPCTYDLGLLENALRIFSDGLLQTNREITVELSIRNTGLRPFDDMVSIRIFSDQDKDSLFTSADVAVYEEIRPVHLDVSDSLVVRETWLPSSAGNVNICAVIGAETDQKRQNNSCIEPISIYEHRETVCLNEIRFLTEAGEPEWIELLNTGTEPVVLENWSIADSRDTCLIRQAGVLEPGAFKVLAADSGILEWYHLNREDVIVLKNLPTLNNAADTVFLIHPLKGLLEMVPYTDRWLESELWRRPSLERINPRLDSQLPSSWGPCTGMRGTPGAVNSIYASLSSRTSRLAISPDPFSPDGDGFEDHALITVRTPVNAGRIRATIYTIGGVRVARPVDNTFFGTSFSFSWDGKDSSGQRVAVGIYLLLVEILDDRNGVLKEFKKDITVARPL